VLRGVGVNHRGMMTGANYAYGTIDLDYDRYTIALPPANPRFVAIMARNELLGVAEDAGVGTGPDVPIDFDLLPEEPLVRAVHFTATSTLDGKPLDNVQLDLMCYPCSAIANSDVQMLGEPDEQRVNPPLVHELTLPIGRVLITTYRHDCARDHLWAEIPPGEEPLELTLALVPAGKASIRGEVVDHDGKPVVNARLRLYRKSDMKPVWEQTERMPGTTDATGRFELRELPATDYVVATAPAEDDVNSDLAPTAIIVAAKDEPQPCRLVLPRGVQCVLDVSYADGARRTVRLRVMSSDGLPLIDDFNHYSRYFGRQARRSAIVLPRGPTMLEFHGQAGALKSIPFDPSLSTSATVILPAN
jgi:hypothetical protein